MAIDGVTGYAGRAPLDWPSRRSAATCSLAKRRTKKTKETKKCTMGDAIFVIFVSFVPETTASTIRRSHGVCGDGAGDGTTVSSLLATNVPISG